MFITQSNITVCSGMTFKSRSWWIEIWINLWSIIRKKKKVKKSMHSQGRGSNSPCSSFECGRIIYLPETFNGTIIGCKISRTEKQKREAHCLNVAGSNHWWNDLNTHKKSMIRGTSARLLTPLCLCEAPCWGADSGLWSSEVWICLNSFNIIKRCQCMS